MKPYSLSQVRLDVGEILRAAIANKSGKTPAEIRDYIINLARRKGHAVQPLNVPLERFEVRFQRSGAIISRDPFDGALRKA